MGGGGGGGGKDLRGSDNLCFYYLLHTCIVLTAHTSKHAGGLRVGLKRQTDSRYREALNGLRHLLTVLQWSQSVGEGDLSTTVTCM